MASVNSGQWRYFRRRRHLIWNDGHRFRRLGACRICTSVEEGCGRVRKLAAHEVKQDGGGHRGIVNQGDEQEDDGKRCLMQSTLKVMLTCTTLVQYLCLSWIGICLCNKG